MRLLKHNILRVSRTQEINWEEVKLPVIVFGQICSSKVDEVCSRSVSGRRIHYSYDRQIFTTVAPIEDLLQVESICYGDAKDEDKLVSESFYYKIRSAISSIEAAKTNIAAYKEKFTIACESKDKYQLDLKATIEGLSRLSKLGYDDMKTTITFTNVVAEDTCREGRDIELGDLTFEVDFSENECFIKEGSFPKKTSWSNTSWHPHTVDTYQQCFGSMDLDIQEAIRTVNIDVLKVLLHKFAHSYTSSDSAGKDWKLWCDIETVYVDGELKFTDEVVFSNVLDRYLDIEAAEYISRIDDYVPSDDVVYSEHYGENIYSEHADEAEGYGWIEISDPDFEEVNGTYYHKDDLVDDINGDIQPISQCKYSTALDKYIHEDDAVEFEGDYYTSETLPTPVDENKVEEKIDEVSEVDIFA